MQTLGDSGLHQHHWLTAPGGMASKIRQFPWETTPLGPMDSWCFGLLKAVELMLSCGFPTTLQWGPEATLLYNDPYTQLIGERHPAALGKPIFESFPEIRDVYGPLYQRVRDGETVVLEDMPYRYKRDGSLTDTWFNLSYGPVRDDGGNIAGVMAIGFETTSRVALSQSEERYRTLFENVDDGCMIIEQLPAMADGRHDYRYVLMNRVSTAMFGKPDLTGRTSRACFPEEDEEWYEILDRVVDSGDSVRFERTAASQGMVLEMFLARVGEAADRRLLVLIRDVTERRRSQDALRQAEKLAAVGRLASSIAHEINNPLEAVTNLVYLARQAEVSTTAADLLDQADRELRRVSLITRETLRFHRQHAQPSPTDIAELLDAILLLHESRLSQARITTERRYRPHPQVLCRPDEIRQVLANLITNAIEAMAGNDRTRILTLRIDAATDRKTGTKGVRLLVGDTGKGMSAAAKARAFEPFFTTKEATNSGLGLWISREIITKHSGALRFRSCPAPARSGTLFTLFLPTVRTA